MYFRRKRFYANGKNVSVASPYNGFPFELVYMVMDPGYNEGKPSKIIDNAALLEIPIEIFNTDIFNAANSVDKSPLLSLRKDEERSSVQQRPIPRMQ